MGTLACSSAETSQPIGEGGSGARTLVWDGCRQGRAHCTGIDTDRTKVFARRGPNSAPWSPWSCGIRRRRAMTGRGAPVPRGAATGGCARARRSRRRRGAADRGRPGVLEEEADRRPRTARQVDPPPGEHGPPFGRVRLGTQAQEAEPGRRPATTPIAGTGSHMPAGWPVADEVPEQRDGDVRHLDQQPGGLARRGLAERYSG